VTAGANRKYRASTAEAIACSRSSSRSSWAALGGPSTIAADASLEMLSARPSCANPSRVDESEADVPQAEHLVHSERGGGAGRVAPFVGGCSALVGLQVVTERAEDRQVLDDERMLDRRKEPQFVKDLLATQRTPHPLLSLCSGI